MNAVAAPSRTRRLGLRLILVLLATYVLVVLALMWWWDTEPDHFDVAAAAQSRATVRQQPVVTGSATTAALVDSVERMLGKRGGYLSNDRFPPGVLMDNQPNWEFGALTQVRDFAKAFRNEFSRSQTQSTEDPDLQEADPLFSSPNDRWLLPSSESQYRKATTHLEGFLTRLTDADTQDAQFFARADNLADWLAVVEKRLGSLSQRLSASVGQLRLATGRAKRVLSAASAVLSRRSMQENHRSVKDSV